MTDFFETLPALLKERAVSLNNKTVNASAEYVLYWMHHAMRGDDNPALDLALWLGDQLSLPVLVYQGLSGQHPFNNDRHHFFIMQGARDVANQLRERKINYRFFLPAAHADTSPLPGLINGAAATVMEAMPVAPFNRWQPRLAERAKSHVFQIDARCIVPVTLSAKTPTRAFEFRDQFKHEYAARVTTGWLYQAPAPIVQDIPVKIPHLDIADMTDQSLLTAIATQPIDHAIGPVADTPGGSSAGLARWQHFANNGLRRYDKTRNDAALDWPNSVSRLSAYFHYGQISPMRIAKEAAAIGGSGADKFLDELTIWRELAQHYCWHCDDPDSLMALPKWARDTLNEHRDDPRQDIKSARQLAHAKTDDALWNLAQQSLLIHGELHNNLRMTWAKALPKWTATPEQAQAQLIALNHRYALDGNDPSSYGGLLWALGLFDRPFKPEQPILGSVRPRSSRAHQKRLDMETYRTKVQRPQGRVLRIAVIGAGVSGLSAASALARHQHEVTVFEKSRGPGGRSATKRSGEYRFNHGAQYFTVRDHRMAEYIDSWKQENVIEHLTKKTARIRMGKASDAAITRQRYRGLNGMNQLCKTMAEGLQVNTQSRITNIRKCKDGWTLEFTDASATQTDATFDVILSSAPAKQAAVLLRTAHPEFSRIAHDVEFTPCWALMLRTSQAAEGYDAGFVDGSPIGWVATDKASDGSYCWTIHASTTWSSEHLEDDAEKVMRELSRAFKQLTGLAIVEDSCIAHRWRYARVSTPLQRDCLFDTDAGIGLCGDWCHDGARVESAWLSGQALAGRVLGKAIINSPLAGPAQGSLLDLDVGY